MKCGALFALMTSAASDLPSPMSTQVATNTEQSVFGYAVPSVSFGPTTEEEITREEYSKELWHSRKDLDEQIAKYSFRSSWDDCMQKYDQLVEPTVASYSVDGQVPQWFLSDTGSGNHLIGLHDLPLWFFASQKVSLPKVKTRNQNSARGDKCRRLPYTEFEAKIVKT